MALKKSITKAEFDKLSDEMKKAYKAGEFSDTYVIDTGEEGDDDPAELRRALAREREAKKKLQKDLKALKDAAEGGTGEAGEGDDDNNDDNTNNNNNNNNNRNNRQGRRAEQDAKTIDANWLKKYNKDTGTRDATIAAQQAFIRKSLVNGTATAMATKISTSPTLLSKAIAERLSVDFDGDEPELVILGADGKPAAGLTLDGLQKEFVANKEFASIMIASKASGGGAPKAGADNKTGGGAPASDSTVDLSKLSGKDLAARLKAQKADA